MDMLTYYNRMDKMYNGGLSAGVMMMKRFFMLLTLMCLLPCAALSEGEMVLMDETGSILMESTESRDLILGLEGEDVSELQQRLADLSYYTDKINGVYGESTQAAVMAFQKDFDLEPSGRANAQTQAQLYAALYRPLQYGTTGEDVKRLQTRLTELGYYTGKISGNYLDATCSAIEKFQAKMGELSTGVADIDTLSLVYSGDALSAHAKVEATPTPVPDLDSMDFSVIDDENAVRATPVPEIAFTKKLSRNSTGKLVKQVQERLTELGYYEGPISGNFLGHTANAVNPQPFKLQDNRNRADEALRISLQKPIYANVEIPLEKADWQRLTELTLRLTGDVKLCWFRCVKE